MRAVFIGASPLTVMTAESLLRAGHEVVIIEKNRERITECSAQLDCGFIHGDGSRPAILREANPEQTDCLFCLTNNDQVNIIAGLVGRSLQFSKVVTQIEDPEFEHVCVELGLQHTIIPDRAVARSLTDIFHGRDPTEFAALIKHDTRFFSFVARPEDAVPIDALNLPDQARVICVYRKNTLWLPDPKDTLREDDEVVIVTQGKNLPALEKRWTLPRPPPASRHTPG